MTEYTNQIRDAVKAQDAERAEILSHVGAHFNALLDALVTVHRELLTDGLGHLMTQPKSATLHDRTSPFSCTIGDWKLVFAMRDIIARDDQAPYTIPFAGVNTGRIFVFPNEPDAWPAHSYWINRNGQWASSGIGWQAMGEVNDSETTMRQVRDMVKSLLTETKYTWGALHNMRLNDASRGSWPTLGFSTPNEEDQP